MDQGISQPASAVIGHPAAVDDAASPGFAICVSCGEEFYPTINERKCYDCRNLEAETMALKAIATEGSADELREQLAEMERMTDDALIGEAAYWLEKGDVDEARFRSLLYARPKFSCVAECREKYNKAMAEKRARAAS